MQGHDMPKFCHFGEPPKQHKMEQWHFCANKAKTEMRHFSLKRCKTRCTPVNRDTTTLCNHLPSRHVPPSMFTLSLWEEEAIYQLAPGNFSVVDVSDILNFFFRRRSLRWVGEQGWFSLKTQNGYERRRWGVSAGRGGGLKICFLGGRNSC